MKCVWRLAKQKQNTPVLITTMVHPVMKVDSSREPPKKKQKRLNPIRIKGTLRSDGCILPAKPPAVLPNGSFKRPVGRAPIGVTWDEIQGLWVPIGDDNGEIQDGVGLRRIIESFSQDKPNRSASPLPEVSMPPPPRQSLPRLKDPPGQPAAVAPVASSIDAKSISPPLPSEELHQRSRWQEEPRDDGLTLYDIHREPRPVVTGLVRCPRRLLEQEFRCVICLGRLHNTRVVVECLHRFCEECIERSFRVLGRNQCPICRTIIPSRRSLAPDPLFDKLVAAILPDDDEGVEPIGVRENDRCSSGSTESPPETLQQAIHRKQKETLNTNNDRTQQEASDTSEDNGAVANGKPKGEDPNVPLIDIALLRHGEETQLDELYLPYLRLKENATIEVIKEFLQQKLNQPAGEFQVISFPHPDRPVILTDWIKLSVVARTLSNPSMERVHLYYRMQMP